MRDDSETLKIHFLPFHCIALLIDDCVPIRSRANYTFPFIEEDGKKRDAFALSIMTLRDYQLAACGRPFDVSLFLFSLHNSTFPVGFRGLVNPACFVSRDHLATSDARLQPSDSPDQAQCASYGERKNFTFRLCFSYF